MRGRGKHKDKKSKAEKKQVTSQKSVSNEGPAILESEKEAIFWMWEEIAGSRKFIEVIPEGSDVEMEQALQSYRTAGREVLGWDQGQADMMECGLRWAVCRSKEKRKAAARERATAAARGRAASRTGTKQARQTSGFWRRGTVAGDTSGKRRRAGGGG